MEETEERLRGDLQKDLLCFIYLKSKFEEEREFGSSSLKRIVGYSGTGGVDSAVQSLVNMGFLEQNAWDKQRRLEITQKGRRYIENQVLAPVRVLEGPIALFFTFLGTFSFILWVLQAFYFVYFPYFLLGLSGGSLFFSIFLKFGLLRHLYRKLSKRSK